MHSVNVLMVSRKSTTKTNKYVKELSLNFLQLKTELKTPTGSFFIAAFVEEDG